MPSLLGLQWWYLMILGRLDGLGTSWPGNPKLGALSQHSGGEYWHMQLKVPAHHSCKHQPICGPWRSYCWQSCFDLNVMQFATGLHVLLILLSPLPTLSFDCIQTQSTVCKHIFNFLLCGQETHHLSNEQAGCNNSHLIEKWIVLLDIWCPVLQHFPSTVCLHCFVCIQGNHLGRRSRCARCLGRIPVFGTSWICVWVVVHAFHTKQPSTMIRHEASAIQEVLFIVPWNNSWHGPSSSSLFSSSIISTNCQIHFLRLAI